MTGLLKRLRDFFESWGDGLYYESDGRPKYEGNEFDAVPILRKTSNKQKKKKKRGQEHQQQT